MLPLPLRSLAALAIALTAFGLLGCAEERKPINKVQANALAKSFFVGNPGDPSDDPTFYWRNFVVDASEGQQLIGIGSWSGVDRIKWEISETTLFARRAYNQNEGADDKGVSSGFPNGTIVAAYPISSHFDVKRAYNPQTGEELNVIEENTTDRPWYQRDYFRVDWSTTDKVDTPQWEDMFFYKLTGDLTLTPITYYVSDPDQDDAPHFDADAGYFDVTSKFLVAPRPENPEKTPSEGSSFPMCAYLGFYAGNALNGCDAQEAVIRSSYLRVDKVDPDGDFEPFENTRANLDVIGNPGGLGNSLETGVLTPPRVTFDPGYGYVDPTLTRLMHVHDIWKQSHQAVGSCKSDGDCASVGSGSVCLLSGKCTVPCSYAARKDANANGTDDQCEKKITGYKGSDGSQCSFRNRCTIPYRDRETKPVAWTVNTDMPDSLQDTVDSRGRFVSHGPTEDVVLTWNQALKLAVAHAREVECRRTHGSRPDCHAQYFDTKNPIEMLSYGGFGIERVKSDDDMAVTCHNPVRDYDPEVCGKPGAIARVGDLRHHFIFYWPFSSRAPWGGVANWNADPLTGQIVGASATIMGRSATLAAAQIRDILSVANGELQLADITNGTPASLYQRKLQLGQKPVAMTAEEIARRVSAVDVKHAATQMGIKLSGATVQERLAQLIDLKASTTSDPGMLSAADAQVQGLAAPLLGTQYEAQLISPSWLVDSAGLSPTSVVNDSTLSQVSPLRGMDPARMTQLGRVAQQQLSSRGVCMLAPGDGVGNPEIRGLAPFFGDANTGIYGNTSLRKTYPELAKASDQQLAEKRAGLIYDHWVKEAYKGIALHEVGHALGMLHNFASSYDATNYVPQYWQLRTNEGQAMDSCNGQPRSASAPDSCMGPRFLDPETDDELGQGDEPRPGITYFGSTSTMEYQNERFFESIGMGQYDLMTMGALYGRVLETFDPDPPDGVPLEEQSAYAWLNFTQLTEDNLVDWTTPLIGRGPQPMHYTELARRIKLFDAGRCRDATPDELKRAEWRIVHGKVCTPPPKDHAAWGDFIDVPGNTSAFQGPKSVVAPDSPDTKAAKGQVRWPYRWGEDRDAYLHVNPSDAGADPYEVTRETIRKFDYTYPFTYFRRQRRDWNFFSIPSSTALQFFERLRSYHWVLARNNSTLPSLSPADLDTLKATDDNVRASLLAATDILDAISRAILLPQIGDFTGADAAYQIGTDAKLYDVASPGARGTLFTLDASTARFVDPTFDTGAQAGGSWDYLHWIGHAGFDVEKSFAAQALTDGRPTLAIIQRETYIDGRHIYVNFETDLAKGVDRLIGGVLAADWDTVAPYVSTTVSPTPQTMSLSDSAPARPQGSFILFPNLGYLQQLGTVVWAQLFSRLGTDLALQNKLLVYLEGTEGVIEVPDAQKTKFTDPRSGFTYVARLYGPDQIDGRTIDSGIASRMVARANKLLTLAYQVDVDADGKPVADPYGRPSLSLDASGQPVPTGDDSASKAYNDYVGLLDAMVEVARRISHGARVDLSPPGP